MYKIEAALRRYASIHSNHPPTKLAELVPDYIGTNDLRVFFTNWKNTKASPLFTLENIESAGAYDYYAETNWSKGILLSEHWRHVDVNSEILVITINYQLNSFRAKKLARILDKK